MLCPSPPPPPPPTRAPLSLPFDQSSRFGDRLHNLILSTIFCWSCFLNLVCFAVCFSVQSPGQAVGADPRSIAVLGAVRAAEHAAEVEADQEVTAYQLALTTSVEASRKAATKAQTNRGGRINDGEARPEKETTKNERNLGDTTGSTSERNDLIVINGKRCANEVGHLFLRAGVDREVEVPRRDRAGNMNKGEKRRSEKTGIATGMEWTIGAQGIKDAAIGIEDNARIILYLVYIDKQCV